jgi:hypothetical protein
MLRRNQFKFKEKGKLIMNKIFKNLKEVTELSYLNKSVVGHKIAAALLKHRDNSRFFPYTRKSPFY